MILDETAINDTIIAKETKKVKRKLLADSYLQANACNVCISLISCDFTKTRTLVYLRHLTTLAVYTQASGFP